VQTLDGKAGQISVTWENSSPTSNPIKPVFWGGDYIDFVRVIIPATAQITEVIVDDQKLKQAPEFAWQIGLQKDIYTVEKHDLLQTIGFWTKVPARGTAKVEITYQDSTTRPLLVLRQPGIVGFDYQLVQDGKIVYKGLVTRDLEIK
jgi:hypothetical protein